MGKRIDINMRAFDLGYNYLRIAIFIIMRKLARVLFFQIGKKHHIIAVQSNQSIILFKLAKRGIKIIANYNNYYRKDERPSLVICF